MLTRHRILLGIGIASLVLAVLPWLGFGRFAFAMPGVGLVPRLSFVNETDITGGRLLYAMMEMPLLFLCIIPSVPDLVLFAGEGVQPVRPFMVFVFWLVVGIVMVWIAVRPLVMPAAYGHLRQKASPEGVG